MSSRNATVVTQAALRTWSVSVKNMVQLFRPLGRKLINYAPAFVDGGSNRVNRKLLMAEGHRVRPHDNHRNWSRNMSLAQTS
jgi:hypothetical protein